MVSLTVTDRSTICVLEENLRQALEEFINVDPTDRWTVEDLIARFARKETVTEEDVTVGYVLLSVPEKTIEISLKENEGKGILEGMKATADRHGFKIVS